MSRKRVSCRKNILEHMSCDILRMAFMNLKKLTELEDSIEFSFTYLSPRKGERYAKTAP